MGIKRFIRYITAIILIASALFIFLSFLSYSPNDPPFADYPGNSPVHNFCGIGGAQIAGYTQAGLGRTSYLIVVLVGWLGVSYLFKESIEYLWVKMIGAVLLLFSVASLLTLGCYAFKKSLLSANVGGIFGIVVVSRLYEYFNLTGTIIILASGLVISIMLLLNVTPVSPFIKLSRAKKERSAPTHDSENEDASTRYRARVNALNNPTSSTNKYLDSIPENITGEIKMNNLHLWVRLKIFKNNLMKNNLWKRKRQLSILKLSNKRNVIMNCHQLISWKSPQLNSIQMIGIKLHNAHKY